MKTTLWNILNNNVENLSIPNGITIPKIQRDYAQGRNTLRATEIRNEFLKNIHDVIIRVKDSNSEALDLDFVYGTNDLGSFIPLDGQQRLTTLFLLHWYLVFKENKINKYADVLTKFNYETRPTSNLFLKALCNNFKEEEYHKIFSEEKDNIKGENIFRSTIKNENWYFSAWRFDNSIESMITMLDAIHIVFKDSTITIDDLIKTSNPPITFNFLQLDTFGLTDTLYIKMNARGKQLTNFENLKAQIAKLIKESSFNDSYNYQLTTREESNKVDVETYFVTRVDTTWSDYFWRLKDDENRFDNKLLNLLTFISLNELILIDIEKYEYAIGKLSDIEEISYYSLKDLGLLNEQSLIKYIDILDVICINDSDIQSFFTKSSFENNILTHVFSDKVGPHYERRVLFQGILDFILRNKNEVTFSELQKWSRLLHNLTINTIYDNSKDFLTSLNGISSFLEKYNGDVYQTLIEFSIKGFDTMQTKEEIIKHQLKTISNEWVSLIDSIENHGFLNGQISSLLVMSSIYDVFSTKTINEISVKELDVLYSQLKNKFTVFNKVFNSSGLIDFENEEFRRALLSYGDFAIYSTNWFFYNNSNHRDLSWKRLLKETANKSNTYKEGVDILLSLFADLDENESITKQLNGFIKKYLAENKNKDWKYYFIKYPILFLSSEKKYVKIFDEPEDEYIYCLNKTKYNRESDFDFMSLVLISRLESKGFDTDKIEFEYNTKYDQFGISKINGRSIKVLYNSPEYRHKFLIKKHGDDLKIEKNLANVESYLIDNYFS